MNSVLTHLSFVLALCGTGAFAGVMLSIGLSFGSLWQQMPADQFLVWFSAHSDEVSRPVPIVVLPAFVGILGGTVGTWSNRRRRVLWLSSLSCFLVLLIITFAYFVPMNSAFTSGTVAIDDVPQAIDEWLWVHNFRILLGLCSCALAGLAVALPHELRTGS